MQPFVVATVWCLAACGGTAAPAVVVDNTVASGGVDEPSPVTCFPAEPGLTGEDLDRRARTAIETDAKVLGDCAILEDENQIHHLMAGDAVVAVVDACGIEVRTAAHGLFGALVRVGDPIDPVIDAAGRDRFECHGRLRTRETACGLRLAENNFEIQPSVYYWLPGLEVQAEGAAAVAFARGQTVLAIAAWTWCN